MLLREFAEIGGVLPLALPAVAEIGVVAGDHDHPPLVVEEGPDDVAPLAEALERELRPPYRAEAVRRGDGLWAEWERTTK